MSVFSGGAALTTNVGSGGELVVASAGSATDTMLSGGALLVRSGGSALSAITFAGSGDLLAVVEPVSSAVGNAVSATLSGLGAGDTIDLSGITYVSPGASAGIVGDVLTVSDGGKAYSFQLDAGQNYVGYQFQIGASTDDGPFGPGTDVAVLCFRPGTRIATPFGTAPVETLRPGDLVLTASGQAEPVCRLGVQTVSLRFADPLRALPIRVRAGALAERVPSRDLLVSPGHALLIDGVLAQAGALVNGSSVVREAVMPEIFRYYHLELAAHAVLLAEDTPAESYLDGVEAMAFDDAGAREAAAPAEQLPYPRIKAQRQLPQAVRARLMARAALLAARPAA
jgi:autotransporter passenger strand-loop-strand repeat protein